ncbi:phosphoglycerate kinase, chloroplastic-like [Dorcoceras hygrometricum]|uniref:Phosphoglycerate kinase, chloroplastic-like n=1 Tax=Dorcoceras hygrometricum TaxID=472368 RepID=A0A2Z7DE49_9LAMI|nr:phosphoglycerate kinase, chloroplastic-like [Dorcoceras hygrometricum]
MTFRVVRTNQYNQDIGLIYSTNGNHLESPNEGSSIDHHVTIYLHAQNITMFPINETWCVVREVWCMVGAVVGSYGSVWTSGWPEQRVRRVFVAAGRGGVEVNIAWE